MITNVSLQRKRQTSKTEAGLSASLHIRTRINTENRFLERRNSWLGEGVKLKEKTKSLDRWLSWLECHPVHRKVAGSISSQSTYLGCRLGPWLERNTRGNWLMFLSHINVYLPLCLLPFPLSLKSIGMSSDKDKKERKSKKSGASIAKDKQASLRQIPGRKLVWLHLFSPPPSLHLKEESHPLLKGK